MEARSVRDAGWVNGLFAGAVNQRDERFGSLRVYTSAKLSFADTSMGGNKAINAPPQFTRFCDPPVSGVFAQPYDYGRAQQRKYLEEQDHKGSFRQGAFYNEAIESNGFYLHCRFGKPKYVGMASFLANMYDSNLAYLARTGDYPGMIRGLATYVTAAACWAVLGTVAFGALLIIPRVLKAALNKEASRYYYVKPTMHLYLRTVQTMINSQLIYRRLAPTKLLGMFPKGNTIADENNKYNKDRADLYAALPDIWKSKDGGEFDVYKMINRYQLLANYQANTMDKIYRESTTEEEVERRVQRFYKEALFTNALDPNSETMSRMEISLAEMERTFAKSSGYYAGFNRVEDVENQLLESASSVYGNASENGATSEAFSKAADTERQALLAKQAEEAASKLPTFDQTKDYMDAGQKTTLADVFGDYLNQADSYLDEVVNDIGMAASSELRNGSQWITWKIDGRDTVGRNINNSTKDPEIKGMVNGATSKARSMEVNLSNGKTGFDAVDDVLTGFKSAFAGALDFLHLSGLMSLYNSSVVDFPEVWDGSDMSNDDVSITIPLRCWSGNDLDVMQDLIIPVCFWTAAACPIATGKQSFTHPFYVECYSPGRYSIRNGLVTSLGMQFGVGGLGWRKDGLPLSCDLTVTIRDMTRAMFMPIVTDQSVWDDDNKFTEFMAILGAATLHERTSGIERAIINLSTWQQNLSSIFSWSNVVNAGFDLPPARMIANIFSSATGLSR